MAHHIKRQTAPSTWPIIRKGKERWLTTPHPAGLRRELVIPINIALRDALGLAETTREAKKIMTNNTILVNNTRVVDVKQSVGLFDVLTIKELKKSYRVVLTVKNKLVFEEVKASEANKLPLKLRGKTLVRGAKQQLNFTNGRTLLNKLKIKVNSSVIYDSLTKKILETFDMKKGVSVVLTGGKHVGKLAELVSVEVAGLLKKKKLAVLKLTGAKASELVKTELRHVFVVGGAKPAFTAVNNG